MALQQTMRALADPIRREILNMLKGGRLSAGAITDHFSVTAASISRHLSVLKEADLIRDTREGKFIYYELNASVLEEILLWVAALKGEDDHVETTYETWDFDDAFDFDSHAGWCAALESPAGYHGDPLGC